MAKLPSEKTKDKEVRLVRKKKNISRENVSVKISKSERQKRVQYSVYLPSEALNAFNALHPGNRCGALAELVALEVSGLLVKCENIDERRAGEAAIHFYRYESCMQKTNNKGKCRSKRLE